MIQQFSRAAFFIRSIELYYHKQAFDSIAGNTVVPNRSLKMFLNRHMHLFIAILLFI